MEPKFEHCYNYEGLVVEQLRHFLQRDFQNLCYTGVLELQTEFAYSEEPVPFKEIGNLKFKPIQLGDVWAEKNFDCAWFHLKGKLPKDIDRKELYLDFSNQGEGLLVDKNGHAVKGFTAGSPVFGVFDYAVEKRFYPLVEFIDEEGNIEAYIDGAANGIVGEFNQNVKLAYSRVSRRNPELEDLFWDFDVLFSYMNTLPFGNERKPQFIQGLRTIMNLIVYNDPDMYKKAKAISKELFTLSGEDNTQVTAVGHAHLDLAWLWPVRETKRKALRTFATALDLLKKYPTYHFVVSQPQQLAWVKELDPQQYEEIKHFVKEGRLEPVGGGWVENDTNLPCEESLVRQELYGQMFWKEEFGEYVNLRWLPDTFGYSACLPQVLKLTRQDYFMTIKLSWSNRTLFPYHTFTWEGIDGSEVVVHMPPEGTYNSRASAEALVRGKIMQREADYKDSFLMVYGIGDGGGGPNETMVEHCLREENIPYLPKVKMDRAQKFFDDLEGKELPHYAGEMYLEKHRGTYTSQSNCKNFNREFEGKMLSFETLLSCLGEAGDKEKIDTIWKEALLYQFHDIIPGSSILRVYDETEEAYVRLMSELEGMANKYGASFVPAKDKCLMNMESENVAKLVKDGDDYLYFNGNEALIKPVVYDKAIESNAVKILETELYTITFDEDGSFSSIVLKENGKVAVTEANKLRVFIDRGDAWDFEDDYRDQPEQYMTLVATKVRDFGELIEVKQNYEYKSSKLLQTILVHKRLPLIEITHDIDWKDTGYMLRAEFLPTAWPDVVHSDIQFGYLDRPTTDNTEHEVAQFEMCCQKWFDLSNDKQGFALLNNAKDGFMSKKGIVSLNLLRSTNYPCVNSEQQRHVHYSYALYPHVGGFDPVRIDVLAKGFNMRYLYGDQALAMPTVDSEQVRISAFKPAYNGDGFVLRLFECGGKAAKVKLSLPTGCKLGDELNLLEEKIGEATTDLEFKPFQIRTFKILK